MKRLFSTHQIADLLGTNQAAVDRWIEKGWLETKDLPNGETRVSEEALVSFLKDRGVDLEALMGKLDDTESADLGKQELTDLVETLADEVEDEEFPPTADSGQHVREVEDGEVGDRDEGEQVDAAGQLAEAILHDAVTSGASHIFLDPYQECLALRVRIDGVIHDKVNFRTRLPKVLAPRLIEHFKTLAELTADRVPQSGEFRSTLDGKEYQFSLNTFPTVFGEKLVVEIVDRERQPLSLSQLGLSDADEALLRGVLGRTYGVVLLVGPPRQGKIRVLEAMLGEAKGSGREVVALEHREEIQVEGVTRSRPGESGLTFAEALIAACRADADVIMVSEATDPAVKLVDAGMEGRLVLGSILTDSTVSALQMLLDSAPCWAVAATLGAVINYRSVRRICPSCTEQTEPRMETLKVLGIERDDIDFDVFRGSGCKDCSNTGYLGRTGVFSVMDIDHILRGMLRGGAKAEEVWVAGLRRGVWTLRQQGLEKVRDGSTTLEELVRVLAWEEG